MDEPLEGVVVSDATTPYCPHSNRTTFFNMALWPEHNVMLRCEDCGNKTYLSVSDRELEK